MANWIDRRLGIVQWSSAEAAPGKWFPGMETDRGSLWAATVDGERVVAFETAPGQVVLGLSSASLASVRKVAAGFNIIVEVIKIDEEGLIEVFTIIGPRGRVKKIFAFLGHKL